MPSAPSEQTDLRRRGRQRLIGAAALALVAAVVVPMVLDADPKPSSRHPIAAIPDRNLVAPLAAPEPASIASPDTASPAEPARSAPASPTESPAPAAAKPAESLVATVEVPAKGEAPAKGQAPPRPVATAKADSPVLAGFAVQAGAFRDDVRLGQARKKLTAAGIRHYTERIEAKGGDLTRLRAGPFADREAAAAAAAKMKAAGLDATIVSLP